MILVLDASVIVKWFNKEVDTDVAIKLRKEFYDGKHEFIAPDLILLEVANALSSNSEISTERIKEAILSLEEMELGIVVPSLELIHSAVEIARSKNITIYDAIYVALAKILKCKLITADKKLSEKVNEDFVVDLKEIST